MSLYDVLDAEYDLGPDPSRASARSSANAGIGARSDAARWPGAAEWAQHEYALRAWKPGSSHAAREADAVVLVAMLATQLEEAKKHIDQIKTVSSVARQDVEGAAGMKQELTSMKTQLDLYKTQATDLQRLATQLASESQAITTRYQGFENRFSSVVASVTQTKQDLEQRMENAHRETISLADQKMREVEVKFDSKLDAEIGRRDALNARVSDQQGRIGELAQSQTSLAQRFTTWQDEYKARMQLLEDRINRFAASENQLTMKLQEQKSQYDNKEQELKQQIADAQAQIAQVISQQEQESQQSTKKILQLQQAWDQATQQTQQSSSQNKVQTDAQLQLLQQQLSEAQQSYDQKQAELKQQLQESTKIITNLQSNLETVQQQSQQQVAKLTLQINDDKKRAEQLEKEQTDKRIAEERVALEAILQKVQAKNNLINSILDAQSTLTTFDIKLEEVDRIIRELNDMQGVEQKKSYTSLPADNWVAALNSIANAITNARGKQTALSIARAALDIEQNTEKTTFKTATQKVNEAIDALTKAKNQVSNVKNEADIQLLVQVIQQQDANVTAQNENVTKLQEKKHLANEKIIYDNQRTSYRSAKTELTLEIELKRTKLTRASQNVSPPTPLPPITNLPPLSASGVSSALSASSSVVINQAEQKLNKLTAAMADIDSVLD